MEWKCKVRVQSEFQFLGPLSQFFCGKKLWIDRCRIVSRELV
jgi:hypothetical protein